MLIWLVLVVLGILVGFLSGLLGIGGGIITVPILIILSPYLNLQPELTLQIAIGTSLAISAITLLTSLFQHCKNRNIDFNIFLQFLPGIIVGAVLGPYIVHSLPEVALRKTIGLIFIVLVYNMSFNFYNPAAAELPRRPWMILSGFLFGILATIVGVSGAIFIIPFLSLFGISLHKAVGVAAMCGVPVATIGMLSYIFIGYHLPGLPIGATGYVYWPVVLAFTITSMPVSYFGAKMVSKMPVMTLRRSLALLFIFMAVKMLFF